jgi:hypothetical protein
MFITEATPQEKGLQMLTTDKKLLPDPRDSTKECAAFKVSSPRNLSIRRFPLLISLVIFITLGGLGLGITFALSASSQCVNHLGIYYDYPLKYDPSFVSEKKLNQTYNIVLFGDSLINFPIQYYELSEKISAYLPDFRVEIQNYGIDSNKIGDMRRRVDNMLAETMYVLHQASIIRCIVLLVVIAWTHVSYINLRNRLRIRMSARITRIHSSILNGALNHGFPTPLTLT